MKELPANFVPADLEGPLYEGQYIVKNLVIIGAALVIGSGLTNKKQS